jgi:uncharacterized protein YxeA
MKRILKLIVAIAVAAICAGCKLMWSDYWGERHWWNH